MVQNFVAPLVTNTKKFDHVTGVWRPSVKSQLEVRDVTLLYNIINGLALAYLLKISKRPDVSSIVGTGYSFFATLIIKLTSMTS